MEKSTRGSWNRWAGRLRNRWAGSLLWLASDPENSASKNGQKLIVSDRWRLKFENGMEYTLAYGEIPSEFYVPEKPGYEQENILWCNGYASTPFQVGSTWETCVGEWTWMGNHAATEELQFYNSAGIFVRIPRAVDRDAVQNPLKRPKTTK